MTKYKNVNIEGFISFLNEECSISDKDLEKIKKHLEPRTIEDRMSEVDLSGKCGSCEHYFKNEKSRTYGRCVRSNGSKNYREDAPHSRSQKCCKHYIQKGSVITDETDSI